MATVLWVCPVGEIAGVARHILDAAPALPGYQVSVLCPPGPLAGRLREAGVAVIEGPFGPAYSLSSSLRTLRRAIAQVRPVLAHSHLSYADIALALAAPRTLPLVSTEHGIALDASVYHASTAQALLKARVHRWRVNRFSALIAVSEATAHAMRERWRPQRKITVIRNGVDPVATPAQAGLRILSLARLAPEKRLDRLIAGFAELNRTHPAATLTLAGVGPLHDELTRQIHQLGLQHQVSLPGFVDPAGAMAQADVVALLSASENSPYAVLDALARGLGVVASPAGGMPEMVPAQCLVNPDDTHAVAEALSQQGLDLAQRPALGTWPSINSMCAEIAEAYDGAVRRL